LEGLPAEPDRRAELGGRVMPPPAATHVGGPVQPGGSSHPVEFDVDFPDRQLNRVSTAFRIIWALPILVILAVLSGPLFESSSDGGGIFAGGVAGGILVLPTLLMIVFRQKYPQWWFDFNLAYLRFDNRVVAYLLLLRDDYPSTDEEQAVHLRVPYPDVPTDLNRWMPLVKWFLAIPHYVVLLFLGVAVLVCTVVAWFAILFTGRYPRRMFDFTVGVMRWHNRVIAYAFTLVTDRYPPFRLAA
jgi:hypothetical protein